MSMFELAIAKCHSVCLSVRQTRDPRQNDSGYQNVFYTVR